MKLRFTKQFEKQLDKIQDKRIRNQIARVLQEVKDTPQLSGIASVKKLKGFSNAYRIRSGNYRIGLLFEPDGSVTVAHVDVRGAFYNKFPTK